MSNDKPSSETVGDVGDGVVVSNVTICRSALFKGNQASSTTLAVTLPRFGIS